MVYSEYGSFARKKWNNFAFFHNNELSEKIRKRWKILLQNFSVQIKTVLLYHNL